MLFLLFYTACRYRNSEATTLFCMYVCLSVYLSVRLCGTVMYFETAQGIIKLLFHSLIILWSTPGIVQKIYHMLNTGTLDIGFAIFTNISRHHGNSRPQRILIGNQL